MVSSLAGGLRLLLSPVGGYMFKEYIEEHPEEFVDLSRIYASSERIEIERHRRRQKKLEKIEYYRRLLNERREDNSQ